MISQFANFVWQWSCKKSYKVFLHALRHPQKIQDQLLKRIIENNKNSHFGKSHHFESIQSIASFQNKVPLQDADSISPLVKRIMAGEQNIFTQSPVTHLIPSSGSTESQKLIPWTNGLNAQFQSAISPWVYDLFHRYPNAKSGRAFWSITPSIQSHFSSESKVPIGFDDDASYIGGWKKFLVNLTIATSSDLKKITNPDQFRMQTLIELLACKNLSFVSIWHPSYWEILLDFAESHWERLLDQLLSVDPKRCAILKQFDCGDWQRIWPKLNLISCWGDGAAKLSCDHLKKQFPWIKFQPKGLLATEGVISIPFQNQYPLAITSHFFEFMNEDEKLCLAHELKPNQNYEVILTTAGGLYRYQLGDQVRVVGKLHQTPSIQFIGKKNQCVDFRGEKMTDGFVSQCFSKLFEKEKPKFAMLSLVQSNTPFYCLWIEDENLTANKTASLKSQLESLLLENPNYQWCRNLNQLGEIQLCQIKNASQSYLKHMQSKGLKLGNIKPVSLSNVFDWDNVFNVPNKFSSD